MTTSIHGLIDRILDIFFFFNDTATTEIYTLSLHDALPIFVGVAVEAADQGACVARPGVAVVEDHVALVAAARSLGADGHGGDRKSTRLNSSHANISYAVFCLKKKKYPLLCPYSTLIYTSFA